MPELSEKEIADFKAAQAERDTLKSELEKLKAAPPKKDDPPPADPDLREKARLQKEADDKKLGDTKAMESALKFSLKSEEFLKTNEALLPKDIHDLFKQAEKENYSTAIEKVNAIKTGIIQSFFAVQSNMELLTPGLKIALEDYLKLTKDSKQEKAQAIYDSVFEPAFEMLRQQKKAEALSKGLSTGEGDAYKNRLMEGSKKHFLGGNQNA